MNDYIEVRLTPRPCSETITDILAAMLADGSYESFVPDETGLTAYVPVKDFSREYLKDIIESFPIDDVSITVEHKLVEGRDWNIEWERNYFQPIVIADKCVIHSSFHTDIPKCQYDIVIDPKMAFGTGHHQTTSLIINRLLNIDLTGKHVIDMGTGTGILAILCAMRGAKSIDAIEIDPFAQINAVENVKINRHPEINVILGDATSLKSLEKADLFLANINRNIILADMKAYSNVIKEDGIAIFSGFYLDDIPMIEEEAAKYGLKTVDYSECDRWVSLMMKKS